MRLHIVAALLFMVHAQVGLGKLIRVCTTATIPPKVVSGFTDVSDGTEVVTTTAPETFTVTSITMTTYATTITEYSQSPTTYTIPGSVKEICFWTENF